MSVNLPARRLVSQDDAALIEGARVPRSRFTGSWTRKTTFEAGLLVPFMVDDILPGDHMSYDVTAYVRMATPLFPIFDNQRIDSFFFFVPYRLVWDKWSRFMGEQHAPGDSTDFLVPVCNSPVGGYLPNSIFDHFGLPTQGQIASDRSIEVSALPLRAYHLIYNQWFRDQNLQAPTPVHFESDGPDPWTDYYLRYRAKAHDYFTSALPWPQKFTAPTVALSGFAPVLGLGATDRATNAGPVTVFETANQGSSTLYAGFKVLSGTGAANAVYMETEPYSNDPYVFADLSRTTGVAIEAFRQAFLVQQLLERDARGGTRYVELVRSHFGVTSPDFRLQRPEYIGGGQSSLQVTPVAQTAPTPGAPVGALGAAATAVGSHRASYAATEHGCIIGIMNVRTELSYQQGLNRMWSRRTRFDFYWPALAGLSEQAVLRKEIYMTGDPTNDEQVFGYQERWHEYRSKQSEVTGMFRSYHTGTLDNWHLAQRFVTPPVLGSGFVQDMPPMARVLAAGALASNQQYLADILVRRNAVRPLPMYGSPVSLGRF